MAREGCSSRDARSGRSRIRSGSPCRVHRSATRCIEAHVIHVDHFGNLITDLGRSALQRFAGSVGVRIRVAEATIDRIAGTYADVAAGIVVRADWEHRHARDRMP